MAMSPEVAFLNPPMTFRDLRSLPPPSLDFLVTSPLSMLALTLATWPGAPWVLCGDMASSGTAPASTSGEALSSGIATGVVSAGERVVMVALDGSLSRGPPVSGVPAMSTQSISSASEAALFGAGKWDTSVNIARYAEKGTIRAPSARGRREIRRAAVVVDVETERREMCRGASRISPVAHVAVVGAARDATAHLWGGRGERRRHRVLCHRQRSAPGRPMV